MSLDLADHTVHSRPTDFMPQPPPHPPSQHALIFLRAASAHGFGHVGWAFTATPDEFCVGAVENWGGWAIEKCGKTGAEAYYTADPVDQFRANRAPYDMYKVLSIAPGTASPANAHTMVEKVLKDPYYLISQNCLDATLQVLTAFGVTGLPKPIGALISPSIWFAHVPGLVHDIQTPFYWAGHPLVQRQMARVEEAEALATAALSGLAVSPALQAQMQLIRSLCRNILQAAAQEDWSRAIAEARLLFTVYGGK